MKNPQRCVICVCDFRNDRHWSKKQTRNPLSAFFDRKCNELV